MKISHIVAKGVTAGAALSLALLAPQVAYAKEAGTLGTAQSAGPFQVTLIAAPQIGRTRFEARVTRNNLPVTGARVSISVAMPYHKHGAEGGRLAPENIANVSLDPFFGQYARTVKTGMSGIYEARVIVREGDDKGIAVYRFDTHGQPIAHLGMWHPAGGFEVQLTTLPTATTANAGENRFRLLLTREGYPVTDAEVSVNFTMPQMSRMGSAEAFARLTAQNGGFEGDAKLPHAGDWRAVITIKHDGKTGRATYEFPVK